MAKFPDEVFLYENCEPSVDQPTRRIYLPLVSRAGVGSMASAIAHSTAVCQESDGFEVQFDQNNLILTAQGQGVTVTISTSTARPGVYTIPIVAESNNTLITVPLTVTVTP